MPEQDSRAVRREPVFLSAGSYSLRRLWTLIFVTRHLTIAALALGIALIPQFGDRRLAIAAVLGGLVLPYDIAVHAFARRRRHLPISMPFVYAPIPALFVFAFPVVWFPALIVAAANLTLFATMFEVRVSTASMLVSDLAFGAAVLWGSPKMGAVGLFAYVAVTPAIVVVIGALFDALILSEQRYREYIENANDIIYTHDLQTLRFLSANEAAIRATGYSRDELDKLTVASLVAPDHLETAAEMVARKVAGEADSTTYELEIVTKQGRRIPVEVSTRLIFRRGEPVAVQGIARDISERQQVEAQRLALDKAKTEFIANAAHELRTPLTTLSGLASVLAASRAKMTDEELDGAVQALERQGKRARLLADKLLDLSAVELGRLDVAREPVSVSEVLDRVLEGAPPPTGTSVDVLVSPGLQVMGDALRLGEIFTNLLTNAYRYGGRRIVVDAVGNNGTVELLVTDDGPGVPPQISSTLFEPFTRGDNGGRPDSTGLGLAICSRLADALGGTITYEPAEPTGARFRIALPSVH